MRELKPAGTIARMWSDINYSSFTDTLAEICLFTPYYLQNVEDLCGGKSLLHYDKGDCSFHELGRNNLVERMQGEWLFMMDTDHCAAPDVLVRLLRLRKKYNLRVLSGIYTFKFAPHAPVANLWGKEGQVQPLLDWDRKAEVIEVGSVGAGCLLVDRSVFKEIEQKTGEPPFKFIPGLSEDYSFCKRCKDLNIPVHLAPNVEFHHTIRSVLSIEDYHPDRSSLLQTKTNGC